MKCDDNVDVVSYFITEDSDERKQVFNKKWANVINDIEHTYDYSFRTESA